MEKGLQEAGRSAVVQVRGCLGCRGTKWEVIVSGAHFRVCAHEFLLDWIWDRKKRKIRTDMNFEPWQGLHCFFLKWGYPRGGEQIWGEKISSEIRMPVGHPCG